MKAYIKHISYYLPDKVLTNEALVEEFPEWSVEKVNRKIGVERRHIAASDETAADMAVKAAKRLFEEHGIDTNEVDFILFCTQSPDYFLPTSACVIQDRLGVPSTAGALDFNLGCSGYVYGLALAKGLIASGTAQNILLLTAETYTKYIHQQDKGNRSIFGDGASASLISTEGFAEIGNFALGTDGRGANNLIVKAGASKLPKSDIQSVTDESGALKAEAYLYMNGSEIFTFTLDAVPPLVEQVLDRNGLTRQDIGYVIFHQANKYILDTLRKVCGFSKEKYYVDLAETGNTVSSTIPIAISKALADGSLPPGTNVMIAGFGVGYSWGATILNII